MAVFDPAYPGADAGPDITICTDTLTGRLQAAPLAFPLLGNWVVLSGDAQVVSPGLPGSVVNCPGIGTSTLLWTVFNGPCGETRDTVVVTVEECQTGVPGRDRPAASWSRYDPQACALITDAPAGGRLVLVDASGRTVMQRTLARAERQQLSLAGLPAGVYLARIDDGRQLVQLRFSTVR